jgi:serine/threonine protein kinase
MSGPILVNSYVGEYRLIDFLGAGGMGEVYRATHSKIGRVAAVKILSQSVCDPSFVERFLNEARIQASLQHDNIATLYDFLEFNGRPCIVMEYIEGEELADHIKARGSLPLREAFTIFQSIVEAIDYVHNQGIVHRDIKSNNVKITSTGKVKLLDFGIAKSGASPSLTLTGGVIGTLQYISPEQFKGEVANARTDIWALGVLLYEMLTGHMPFESVTLGELCEKICKASYVPPSVLNASVPRAAQSIVARCLEKNPRDRYQSASELGQDINRFTSAPPAPRQSDRFFSTVPYRYTRRFLASVDKVVAAIPLTRRQAEIPPTRHQAASRPGAAAVVRPLGAGNKNAAALGATERVVPSTLRKRGLIILAAAVLLIAFGFYFFAEDGTSSSPGDKKAYTIDVNGGRAEVYRNGRSVGQTPYHFDARAGEQIDVVLKREGYIDQSVGFSVSENKKTYAYVMERKE